MQNQRVVHTIGHSTRTMEEFLDLLRSNRIETLVDIRRYPGSRRHPHFSPPAFQQAVEAAGIAYLHLPQLGGRRSGVKDSPNGAWRNSSFRGYADHMSSDEFKSGMDRLLGIESSVAIMCAEAVPWRCHRNLVSDALVARGVEVVHILDASSSRRHTLNEHARLQPDGSLTYPGEAQQGQLF